MQYLIFLSATLLLVANVYAQKIDLHLLKILETGQRADVFVSFTGGVDFVLNQVKKKRIPERGVRNAAILEALQSQAASDQRGVQQLLSLHSADISEFDTFWISNEMLVTAANLAIVQEIAKDDRVKDIFLEPELEYDPDDLDEDFQDGDELPARNWHHVKMQTEEGYELLNGNKGENLIVANTDSGVQLEHETLKHNFLGEHGWFDTWEGTPGPRDTHGHGTSCMSLMAGGLGLGVAPAAKWMACRLKGKNDNGTTVPMRSPKRCMQFLVCPDGTENNCTKTPHVFSFSISTKRPGALGADFKVFKEAGIISVIAAGNIKKREERVCGTMKYPASLKNVIAVGSFLAVGRVAKKSAVGPTKDGRVKPDVVAPGRVWMAAMNSTSNTEYRLSSGTSYAAPLVAGLVALLHVRDPDLTFETALKILQESSDHNVTVYKNHLCTNETWDKVPNNFFGHVVVNIKKALEIQNKLLTQAKHT